MFLTDGVVTLRPPRDDDAPAVAAAVQASVDTLEVWLSWATRDYSVESARHWMTDARTRDAHPMVIRDGDGSVVGSCGLQRADAGNGCIELGYWVGRDHTGRGYATRSARLAIQHAFGDLGFHRVEILVAVANAPSQRVAERVGARLEARLTERLFVRGEWHDAFLYAVLA